MRPTRVLFMTAIIILAAGTASAQGLLVEPSIGAKAGVNSSSLQVTGTGTSARAGFVGGAFFGLPLGQMTLQLEALYSQKGFTKSSYQDVTDLEVKLDYLEFPAILNITFPAGNLTPYFYAGFSFGAKLGAESKDSSTGGEWVDVSDAFKGTNSTLLLGGGLRFNRWLIDARFNHGLTDVNDTWGENEVKDRTFSFTLGYGIWM